MRVYELAKKLNLDSKRLLKLLKEYNINVKSHMSNLDAETAEILYHELEERLKKEAELERKKFLESLKKIEIDFPITVRDLASKLQIKPSELLKKLLEKGKVLNINQNIDEETAKKIGEEFGYLIEKKLPLEEKLTKLELKEANLKKRPPVVTLMGHIDHGKTSILDKIRKSNIVDTEAGGITQHIGAYQVETPYGKITFIDTPGHQTFTQMRARGANVTDIVVLVIACDEGVMPQTIEAYNHAKEAGTPIICALNKIDKPQADPEKVKTQLQKIGLVPEEWGGDTICVNVSAKTGQGINELLEMISLQAEMMDLKADFNRPALGVVIEAKLSPKKGILATLLVQHGILKKGDFIVCGKYYGKVRNMYDDRGRELDSAEPSTPVEIIGLDGLPNAGDKFFVVPSEDVAKEIIERKVEEEKAVKYSQGLRLEDVFKKIQAKELKELKIILKSDTYGTAQAIEDALKKLSGEKVTIKIIHSGVGNVSVSDVLLAKASQAIIIGFNVKVEPKAKDLAKEEKVDIRLYRIIYELLDEVKKALEGLLEPVIKKVFLGRAQVKKVFKLSKAGVVAGCLVIKGIIKRGSIAELVRDKDCIFKGKIVSLKRFKDDVREVKEGYECGISLGFEDIKEGDFIDCYIEETQKPKL